MIKTDEGKVVLRYYQPTPKMIRISGEAVVFDVRFGISLAFVDENLVSPLLAYRGGCCGQQRQVVFGATDVQYSHWKDGKGGR